MASTAPNRREDARILRSRAALRAAFLALLERRPFEALTIREITDEAGVGYATFYRHFPTKAALLDDIAADEIRELVSRSLPVLQTQSSAEACLAQFRYVEEHRALWHALLTGGAVATVREEIIKISREVTAEYPAPGTHMPVDLAPRFVASAMVEILSWWLEQGQAVSAEAGASLLDRLVIAPVVNG